MIINQIIPERRSLNDNIDYWKRKDKNGTIECFSKEYYNSDFTRRNNDNNIENILIEIEKLINNSE